MAQDQAKPMNTPPQRPPEKSNPPPRPSLAKLPAKPDHVIRSMTREAAASVIASRQSR